MMKNIVTMLHNLKTNRYHPIQFYCLEDANGCQKYKSKGHHTDGFAIREEALTCIHNEIVPWLTNHPCWGQPKLCLQKDFPWDGEDIPAMVVHFVDTPDGPVPAF